MQVTEDMKRYCLLVTMLKKTGPSTNQAQVTQFSLLHLRFPVWRKSPSSLGAVGADGKCGYSVDSAGVGLWSSDCGTKIEVGFTGG